MQKVQDFLQVAESQGGDSIGTTVINRNPARGRVVEGSTRESYIGHITHTFIIGLGREQVGGATADHLPGLVQVQQGSAKAVDKAIAGSEHAMVKEQPTLRGLHWNRSGAHLGALPAAEGTHYEAVLPPMEQVGAAAEVDIAEGGVPIITGTAEHNILTVDAAGEQDTITVERQECIFHKVKTFKIEGEANADGRSMVAIAPGDVVAVFEPNDARVIAVLKMAELGVIVSPVDGSIIELPGNAIG